WTAHVEAADLAELGGADRAVVHLRERRGLVRRDRAERASVRREAAVIEDVEAVGLDRLVADGDADGQRIVSLGRQADALHERAVLDLTALDDDRPGDLVRAVR